MTDTPLVIILHTLIVIDLIIINIITNLLHEHIFLLAHISILYPLLAPIRITLVLANAPIVIITPFSDDINTQFYRYPSKPRTDRYRHLSTF